MSFIKEKWANFPIISQGKIYGILLSSFFLKSIGSSWDVSYHFKHFREFYQLPHIVNAAGDCILIFILFYLWFKGPKDIRKYLRIILYGILIFIAGIFYDQWYHDTFGIDLTIWSPAHIVLYAGSFVSLLGSFLYVLYDLPRSYLSQKTKNILSILFSVLILDCFWFLLLQHEQGVVMDYALKHGIRLADEELLDIFFRTQGDVYSGLPFWLYASWAVFSMVAVFQFIKRMNFHKYGATIVAFLFLIQRFIMDTIFNTINYPTSAIPFFIILVAFIFDILYNALEKQPFVKNVITSIVPLVGILGLAMLNPEPPIHPPIPVSGILPFATGAIILGYIIGFLLYKFIVINLPKENKNIQA